jgi:hypothetical protein
MALNFNVDPYYDDFDPNKNFHRILFKPGYAVQARELTQSQTILQDQISKFATHIFEKNTPVSGAKVTYNLKAQYIKINTAINGSQVDVANFDGILIQNVTGDVIARVLAVAEEGGGDPPTLVVSYLSGSQFQDSDVIYSVDNVNLQCQAISLNATGSSSVASISDGVFYVINGFDQSLITEATYSIGNFVNVLPQTVILEKYGTTPSLRVGLNIIETIYDYVDDVSLLDPADGSPNYQGPGADRYVIQLDLETRPLSLGDDDGFIEVLRVENGNILKQIDGSVYSTIDDYFAKRTFEESGDYIVNDFKLAPAANTNNYDYYDLKIGKGVAYVHGYRLENQSEFTITSPRSRKTRLVNNDPTLIQYGNYFYVNSANGIPDSSTMPSIDFHIVPAASVNTFATSANTSTYNSTLVGTARLRGVEFDRLGGTSSQTAQYIYKAYLTDVTNTTLSSAVRSSSSSSNVMLTDTNRKFSDINDAYVGVILTVDSGTSAGDTRKVTAYNPTTKTLTVDTPFTVTLDATSNVTLRFEIKDVESIMKVNSTNYKIQANANISVQSKDNGLTTGNTVLAEATSNPELIYSIGYPYVANTSDTRYETTYVWSSQSFGAIQATLTLGAGPFAFLSTNPTDYIIVNEATGAIGSSANVTNITLSLDQKTATLTIAGSSDLSSITATVSTKVAVTDADDSSYIRRVKNLDIANTTYANTNGTKITLSGASTANGNVYVSLVDGQTWIQANAISSISTGQLLYVSDVKRIVRIIDTLAKDTVPTNDMLVSGVNNVTSYYSFDNGQRDSYYGHASIKLIPGKPAPKGDLLVLFDYYEHSVSQGDGYFSVDSYLSPLSAQPESYAQIPSYTAKNGTTYSLRDCLDFRPKVTNAQTSFVLDKHNAYSYIPVNGTVFDADYAYYLARKDKLILSKDKNFQIIEGTPAVSPLLPVEPDGSLVIANLSLDAYTAYVPSEAPRGTLPNLSIEKVKHKRWTMKDISNMEVRVNNIEYYTALNALEKNASSLQVPDVNGLNRFKNGILVDDFSSFATADTNNLDFNSSINRREKKLSAAHDVSNFPLYSQQLLNSYRQLSSSAANTLGFSVKTIGQTTMFTLPYTTANIASQRLASNTVNLNPFGVAVNQGTMILNPPMDNWVDDTALPDLLIVDPSLQIFQASNTVNVLQVGDWKTIPGTTATQSATNVSTLTTPTAGGGSTITTTTTTTTQTYASLAQTTVLGAYDRLGTSYNQTNGYITDISILPYIRPQQLAFTAKGLLTNTPVSVWFDGVNVDRYIAAPDTIELKNVFGTFKPGDMIGEVADTVFYPIATIGSVYKYPNTANVRLSIIGDITSRNYVRNDKIENSVYDSTGTRSGNTAFGTVLTSNTLVTIHRTGSVTSVGQRITDANTTPNLWNFYKVSQTRYGSFNKKYGIWSSANSSGAYLTNSANTPAVFNFTTNGATTHHIKIGGEFAENEVATYQVKVNGNIISFTNDGNNTKKASFTSLSGTNNVSFHMGYTGHGSTGRLDNDSFFACAISTNAWPAGDNGSNSERVVFATDQLQSTAVITNVSSNTALPGGGIYYTKVRQIGLSGLANTANDYYNNSNIKINSTNVVYDSVAKTYTLQPQTFTAKITKYFSNSTCLLDTDVSISMGYNANVKSDITSSYSIDGTANNTILAKSNGTVPKLSTDETGSITGVFNVPANTFKTGERIFKIDNRLISTDPDSATSFAESVFTASGLATKSQGIDFAASLDSAAGTFTRTATQANQLINTSVSSNTSVVQIPPPPPPPRRDPVAQTFIINKDNFPNGAFINSIKLFFRTKPTTTNSPVTLRLLGTENGYPNGQILDHSIVTLTADQVKTSTTPHYLDANTFTEFVFDCPVYIQSNVLYAFMLDSPSLEYNLFLAAQNAIAIPSSVKNLPTDPVPTTVTKIGVAPYVGGLFESQNGITWSVDQSQALMFVMDRCSFRTSANPKIPFVVPRNLPYRKLTSQEISTYYDANNISNLFNSIPGKDILSDAYNITTTDFMPSSTRVDYTFKSTKASDLAYTNETSVSPGKFGCPTYDDISLNDGQGQRVLIANSNSSFILYASLSSADNTVSPIISEDGLSLYNIKYRINNMGLSNTIVTIIDGGTGYNGNTSNLSVVTVSAPDDAAGVQAIATANVVAGVIQDIIFTEPGSGYLKTPTITITDPTTRGSNANVSIVVNGETDPSGGNGIAKYFTKKVVLTPGNDSGDLRVYYTAYRPKGTNIYVYYKILNRNDNQTFEDSSWQLMTTLSGSVNYSSSPENLIEFECAPGINGVVDDVISYTSTSGVTYTQFSQFAIKIVLATNDNTNVPFLTDVRALALPPGTGI